MSSRSESSYPESTAGPTSPIFGTASFSTFTTTALTSLWPSSSNRRSSCGSENEGSEVMTYQDERSVADTEEPHGAIALYGDDASNLDDEDDDSQVSGTRMESTSTLSESYHLRSSSEEFTSTPTRGSRSQSYTDSTPVYSHSYHHSSSDLLGGTLSRTTLTPTYTESTPFSRSYATSSSSSRPPIERHLSPSPAPVRRTAGELISFFEDKAHSRVASAPVDPVYSRPGSPIKPYSTSHSLPLGAQQTVSHSLSHHSQSHPHAYSHQQSHAYSHPHSHAQTRGDPESQRRTKTLSSWSFGSERTRGSSPHKSTSETGSAVSGSVVSGASSYSRSGRGGYVSGLVGAIGGLVGFSSSSSSRMSTRSSRSPPRRRHSPGTPPRRHERTASSPRAAFSQPRRSPPRNKGKERERERASSRGSLSPVRSRARSEITEEDSVLAGEEEEEEEEEEEYEPPRDIPASVTPPFDVAEYGGSGLPINSAPLWYYNVHRLPPYLWSYADGYLFPHMLLLTWVAPTGGRVVVKLDLLSCVEIRTIRPHERQDVVIEREGNSYRLHTFELGYGDSIECLGCEVRPDMLDWFNSIQTVFNGIMSPPERSGEGSVVSSPAPTVSSFVFSDSVISSQLKSGTASVSQAPLSRRSGREKKPSTPTVPLMEGVLRSHTPPLDATVTSWRARAMERSTASEVSSVAGDIKPAPASAPAPAPAPVYVPSLPSSHAHTPSYSYTQSQATRSYVPSRVTASHSTSTGPSRAPPTRTTLSSGSLSAGAHTLLEIGSSTGTDIVASTLSFRGTASASLLGDSHCGTDSSADTYTGTTAHARQHFRTFGPLTAHEFADMQAAMRRYDEPKGRGNGSTSEAKEAPAPPSAAPEQDAKESKETQETKGTKEMPQERPEGRSSQQEEVVDSAEDSDYMTAASPTASFVSLSGISGFPELEVGAAEEEEEEEVPADEPFLPEPAVVDVETNTEIEVASTVLTARPLLSEAQVQTLEAEEEPSVLAMDDETIKDDESKHSEAATPVLAIHDVQEPAESVEPPKVEPVVEAPRHVDAGTQADVEVEIEISLPIRQKLATPQPAAVPLATPQPAAVPLPSPKPAAVPLPPPAETIYSPSCVSVKITPHISNEALQPEAIVEAPCPDSPLSDVLSTLSLVVPALTQLPTLNTQQPIEPTPMVASQTPLPIVVAPLTPVPTEPVVWSPAPPSLPSVRIKARGSLHLSEADVTLPLSARSPSVAESAWPSETDGSYDSSVLNASPSVRSEARMTMTDGVGVVTSPALSDVRSRLTSILEEPSLKAVSEVYKAETQSVVHTVAALSDALTFDGSELDSELTSTPTASSWASTLPPSVPCNSLNESSSSASELEASIYPLSERERSVLQLEVAAPKVFADGACQVDSDPIVLLQPISPRKIALPMSRPPSRRSMSVSALPQLMDCGTTMHGDAPKKDLSVDHLDDLSGKLTSALHGESGKILEHLNGMGEVISRDHEQLRTMLHELLSTNRSHDVPELVDRYLETKSVLAAEPAPVTILKVDRATSPLAAACKVDFATSPVLAAVVDCATSPVLVAMADFATSPPPGVFKEFGSSPLLLAASQQGEEVVPMARKTSPRAILLSPPRRRAVSPDTLMETMSYLSSHHSDDLSEMDLDMGPMHAERVSTGWSSASSAAASDNLSVFSDDVEDGDAEYDVEIHYASEPQYAPSVPPPSPRESVVSELPADPEVYTEVGDSEFHHTEVTSLAGTVDEVASIVERRTYAVSLVSRSSFGRRAAIQMPVPMRAGPPLAGHLADLIAEESESEQLDHQSFVPVEVETERIYADQATSPAVHFAELLSSFIVKPELVDKEVDGTVQEPEPNPRVDKEVDCPPEEQEQVPSPKLVDQRVDSIAIEVETKPSTALVEQGVDSIALETELAPIVRVDKEVDTAASETPTIIYSETGVDPDPEVVYEQPVYEDKDCNTSDSSQSDSASSSSLSEPASPQAHRIFDSAAKDVQTDPMEEPFKEELTIRDLKELLIQPQIAPPIIALPAFLSDEVCFSSHVGDVVKGGLSPALESISSFVQENRAAHEEYRKVHEEYRKVQEDDRKVQEDYRKVHEETLLQVKEMYRLAQDEIRNSVAQIQAFFMQALATQSQVPPMPATQFHQTPLGFAHHATPQLPVFPPMFGMPTPHAAQIPPLTPALFASRDAPVVPSPISDSSYMDNSTVSDGRTPVPRSALLDSVQPPGLADEYYAGYHAGPEQVQASNFATMIPLPPTPFSDPTQETASLPTPAGAVVPELPVEPSATNDQTTPFATPVPGNPVALAANSPAVQPIPPAASEPTVEVSHQSPAPVSSESVEEDDDAGERTPVPTIKSIPLAAAPLPTVDEPEESVDEMATPVIVPATPLTDTVIPDALTTTETAAEQQVTPSEPSLADTPDVHVEEQVENKEVAGVDDDSDDESDMSGFTTPERAHTPVEVLLDSAGDLPAAVSAEDQSSNDREAAIAEEGTPLLDTTSPADITETTEQPSPAEPETAPISTNDEARYESIGAEFPIAIAAATSELREVIQAARSVADGALSASKEMQMMLDSVRTQREEVTRQLEECVKEREAAQADRVEAESLRGLAVTEAESLRELAITEAAAERERGIAERDARITELQDELASLRANEAEQQATQAEALSERSTRIEALESDLEAVRADLEKEKEARNTEQSERQAQDEERRAQDEERERARAEADAKHESRITALEQELAALRTEQEEERQARALQDDQWQAEREQLLAEATLQRELEVSERDTRIEALEADLGSIRVQQEEAQQRHEAETLERAEALAEREREYAGATAERDERIQTLEGELEALRAESDERTQTLEGALAVLRTDSERECEERQAFAENQELTLREHDSAHAEQMQEQQRLLEERDLRIAALEEVVEQDARSHLQEIDERRQLAEERITRIEALEEELATLRAEHDADIQRREAEVAENQAAWEEKEKGLLEAQAERDAQITALEERISQLQAENALKEEERMLADAERQAAWDEKERSFQDTAAELDGRITALQGELSDLLAEREAEKQKQEADDAERVQRDKDVAEAALERERLNAESHDARIKELTDELAALRAEREQDREQRMQEEAERREADRAEVRQIAESQNVQLSEIQDKLVKLAEHTGEQFTNVDTRFEKLVEQTSEQFTNVDTKFDTWVEQTNAQFAGVDTKLDKFVDQTSEQFTGMDTKLDKLAEQTSEQFASADAKLDQLAEQTSARFAEVDTKLDKFAEQTSEQFTGMDTKLDKVAEQTSEQFANVDVRFDKFGESSSEQFTALDAKLEKIDQGALQDREQHEVEKAEAAAKPTVEALFQNHMAELRDQVHQQLAALENDLKTEGTRLHEEVIANVRGTIEEQATVLVTTCLDELGKLLESIGAQQQAEFLSAMRVAIQEQVTFNISFYLDELTKMFDAHGVRHLAETIEAVRATAREQVEYNSEIHLTDFCKNLAPEMLQLFQEIKEKAEEKSRLDRQIDILRRHKNDYEIGDLRGGDDFAEPPAVHVSRSDADLHKAWRGRAKPRRPDAAPEYSQTDSQRSVYPDHASDMRQWPQDHYEVSPPDVALIVPSLERGSLHGSRSPNSSFYRG